MFESTDRGGNWFVQTDEAAPLEYLRGLPEVGYGWPWSVAKNGEAVGGNADPNHTLVAPGFDKQTATAFEADDEAFLRALAMSSAYNNAAFGIRERYQALARRDAAAG